MPTLTQRFDQFLNFAALPIARLWLDVWVSDRPSLTTMLYCKAAIVTMPRSLASICSLNPYSKLMPKRGSDSDAYTVHPK
ncbi:hypothetical protein [Stenomitos frigidus]|uniref:hypothetical protein n=1 Tax=Stenomitos frigidus TaxID=1886765 RepID=UPI0030DA16BF